MKDLPERLARGKGLTSQQIAPAQKPYEMNVSNLSVFYARSPQAGLAQKEMVLGRWNLTAACGLPEPKAHAGVKMASLDYAFIGWSEVAGLLSLT